MITCSATDDINTIDEVQLLTGQAQFVDHDLLARHAPCQRVTHNARLLVDLFEHEIGVAATLSNVHIPIDMGDFRLDNTAQLVVIGDALRRRYRELIVFQNDHITRRAHERDDIRCHISTRIILPNNDG